MRTRFAGWSAVLALTTTLGCGSGGGVGSSTDTDGSTDGGSSSDAGTAGDTRAEDAAALNDVGAPDAAQGTCGDGTVDALESCDDGNTVTEFECVYGEAFCTACTADCGESLALEGRTCGDGVRDPEEVCDRDDLGGASCADLVPGSVAGTPRCAFDCQSVVADGCRVPVCGDGLVEGAERCDDGNSVTEDTCPPGVAECTACDAACSEILSLVGPFCGDGRVDRGEVCDDGNNVTETECAYGTVRCEACSAACDDAVSLVGPSCGDGLVDDVEVCDSGGPPPTECPWGSPSCSFCGADCAGFVEVPGPSCGDGVIDAAFESCDGDQLGGATCTSIDDRFIGGTLACAADCSNVDTSACEGDPCGNGVLDDGEVCDDGNIVTETACPWGQATCVRCNDACTVESTLEGGTCGDGVVNGPERCDRGGAAVPAACDYGVARCEICNDTCDDVLIRSGPFCGDGVVDAEELCDDGDANGAVGFCSPWSCQGTAARVDAPVEYETDEWGRSVAMNADWLVVAHPYEDIGTTSARGAIYVLRRTPLAYTFDARLVSPVTASYSGFGTAVRVVGDEIITSCSEVSNLEGALLTYRRGVATWEPAQTLIPEEAVRGTHAGGVTALDDDVAVIASRYWSDDDGYSAAWVVERGTDGNWGAPQRISPAVTAEFSICGAAVRGHRVALGNCHADGGAGEVVVFGRTDAGWVQEQVLPLGEFEGTRPDTLTYYGSVLAFVGPDLLVAGARGIRGIDGSGALLTYARTGAGWVQVGSPPIDTVGRAESVGSGLVASDTTLAMSHTRVVDGASVAEVVLADRVGDGWVGRATLRFEVGRVFVDSLALGVGDGHLLVGSPFDDGLGADMGALFIY